MTSSSQKISRSQKMIGDLAVVVVLWVGGCGEFFAQKLSDLRAEGTLNETVICSS